MTEKTEMTVKLEPAVPEAWLATVLSSGASPNEFATWVLRAVPLGRALELFAEGAPINESLEIGSDQPAEKSRVRRRTPPSISSKSRQWTKPLFMDFLNMVGSIGDMRPSMSLLGAYLELGPIPSSSALKALTQFDDDQEWQQALRVAKQRLTIQARGMNAPSLFRRAKAGKQGERLHPIEPLLFGWLSDWARTQEDAEQAFPDPTEWGP